MYKLTPCLQQTDCLVRPNSIKPLSWPSLIFIFLAAFPSISCRYPGIPPSRLSPTVRPEKHTSRNFDEHPVHEYIGLRSQEQEKFDRNSPYPAIEAKECRAIHECWGFLGKINTQYVQFVVGCTASEYCVQLTVESRFSLSLPDRISHGVQPLILASAES